MKKSRIPVVYISTLETMEPPTKTKPFYIEDFASEIFHIAAEKLKHNLGAKEIVNIRTAPNGKTIATLVFKATRDSDIATDYTVYYENGTMSLEDPKTGENLIAPVKLNGTIITYYKL